MNNLKTAAGAARTHQGLPPFKAIILDMDGLVLDSEPTYRIAWQRAAVDMGMVLNDEFCDSHLGCSYDKIEDDLRQRFGEEFSLSRFRKLGEQHWRKYVEVHGIKTKPGYQALIEKIILLRIPSCLATNSTLNNAKNCLKLAGIIDDFDILITRDQVEKGKPAPDLYLRAAQSMDLSPESCLAIEDSIFGLQSARSAGAIPIFIPDLPGLDEHGRALSFCVLNSLSELAELL